MCIFLLLLTLQRLLFRDDGKGDNNGEEKG
jgi:hypothetical protein